MNKDQHPKNGRLSKSNSPPAKRRARQVTGPAGPPAASSSDESGRFRRSSRLGNSEDDWQVPDEESSGRVRKLALVASGVVAVVALGIVWQSSMSPEPITAAEHPAIADGVASPESNESPVNSLNNANANSDVTSESSGPTNLQEIWKGRLAALDSKRVKAFENRDAGALAAVNVPDSLAQVHDAKLLEALESRQVKPVSLATTIHSAILISGDNESALLEVVDSRSEYVVTTESMNKTIKRFKAKSQAKWRVSLRNSDGGWRIYSVTPTQT